MKRLVVEALKQRQSVNLNELTALIAKSKYLDTKVVKPKIQRTIRALIKNGSVTLSGNAVFKSDYGESMVSLNLNELKVG